MTKKICVPITNRTNYSKLKHLMSEIRNRFGGEVLDIVASSTILLERYGQAFKDLEADGFRIAKKIDCILMNDSHEAMAKTVGLSIIEHSSYFADKRPDLMLVVGDRFDMLAPVVSASMMNIPIAHIQGGEVSGTIDNTVRNIISKFAGWHFPATELSVTHLRQQGIPADRIYNFGCPAVEYISKIDVGPQFNPQRITKRFKRDISIQPNQKYFLMMMHPDTTVDKDVDVGAVLSILEEFKLPVLVFYPNADAKNSEIVAGIAKYNKNPMFYMLRHMPIEDFVHTMAHAACMISNSSAGIREAASFGTPVINIGHRQVGRERNQNVVDIPGNLQGFREQVGRLMHIRFDRSNIYYQKDCAKRTVDILQSAVENTH